VLLTFTYRNPGPLVAYSMAFAPQLWTSTRSADAKTVKRSVALILLCLSGSALAGCADKKETGRDADSYVGKPCAVEIEFDRAATEQQQQAFRRRLDSIPGVSHVEILSRERNIELFIAALRRSKYAGKKFDFFAARARHFAGPVAIATPTRPTGVPQIIQALETLPGYVSSVLDRPSCTSG
jgi:cell division protein FtsX